MTEAINCNKCKHWYATQATYTGKCPYCGKTTSLMGKTAVKKEVPEHTNASEFIRGLNKT